MTDAWLLLVALLGAACVVKTLYSVAVIVETIRNSQ